ncbi:hypothetical protein HanXRQr2_Chr12g0521771 [Helianthus annuus]|uniref:Uncharacterized protein n=1 Tax=Helianthus annuus TaxID=4232 RepID=A0A251SY17_HELAN|nr:hypothetical protein HanXRQr2_Chr12g0521771 [Helianthus annuus]
MKRVKRSKYEKESVIWMRGEYQEYSDEDQATKRNRTREKEASASRVVVAFKRRIQLRYVVLNCKL